MAGLGEAKWLDDDRRAVVEITATKVSAICVCTWKERARDFTMLRRGALCPIHGRKGST